MIYFDNNATTKIDDKVLECMLPYLRDQYANASSVQHKMGRHANHAIEKARLQVSDFLSVANKEIFFCSGSTEAINTVIKGIAKNYKSKGNHIITCSTEHKAVISSCNAIEKEGTNVSYLPVNEQGQLDLKELENTITSKTILVCLMAANNETGVIHPIDQIAEICNRKGVLFFCDATQLIGKLPFNLEDSNIDILCFSAHKFHGPKGAAALYIRRSSKPIQIAPLIVGGNQENSFRGGTYAVPQIVGLGEAINQVVFDNGIEELRNHFEKQISIQINEIRIHSSKVLRIPNTSNIQFNYVRGNELMTKIPEIAISSGSACVSGSRDPSHVLKAMGLSDEDAYCSLRFSFSKYNTKEEIDQAINSIKVAVDKIREESPVWQMYQEGLL